MFDSVLGRTLGAQPRRGLGAAVSLGLHLLVLAAALQLSKPSAVSLSPPIRMGWPPGYQRANPAAGPSAPLAQASPRRPAAVRPRTAAPAPSVEETDSRPSLVSAPGSGPADAQAPGPSADGPTGPCAALPCSTSAGEAPLLLSAEMEQPLLLSGPQPRYPLAAALEHIGGTLIVRCTVTAAGRVQDCTVLKSLPYLDAPVLEALSARRYRPAAMDGKPVSVRMVFPVRVIPP